MVNKQLGSVFLAASGLLFASCATILNGDTQQINVTSSNGKPFQGSIDGMTFSGPGVVAVKRAKDSKIVSTSTRSCAKSTVLNSEVDPKFFINILIGGTFGSTTDYSTEKMWRYQDNVVVSCQ